MHRVEHGKNGATTGNGKGYHLAAAAPAHPGPDDEPEEGQSAANCSPAVVQPEHHGVACVRMNYPGHPWTCHELWRLEGNGGRLVFLLFAFLEFAVHEKPRFGSFDGLAVG